MNLLRHVVIFVSYSVISMVIAIILPDRFPSVNGDLFLFLGITTLLGSALVHEISVRASRQTDIMSFLEGLAGSNHQVRSELMLARQETLGIRDALVTARNRSTRATNKEVREVVGEVRVLQNIVEQLCSRVPLDQKPGARNAPPLIARDLDERAVLDILQDGLRGDRIDLFAQPVVSLPQRKTRYYECFSRIRSRDGSMVVPEQYIALAEKEGLITTLDNLLLFRCVQLVRRSQHYKYDYGFFCNISSHTLADKDFFEDFIDFIAENAALAPSLILEFSQEAVADHDADVSAGLDRLAELGFRFSMDKVTDPNVDLASLEKQHFRFIKIDAATMLSPEMQSKFGIDFRDLQRSFGRYGIDLIVEKIENEQTLIELLDYNVDYGQGYLFGAPGLAREGDIADDAPVAPSVAKRSTGR